MIRTFDHTAFDAARLAGCKRGPLTVVLPAREVADTIAPICEMVLGLGELIDQLLVVDAGSADGTAEIARGAGAEVVDQADLLPELGPVLGKGDALYRSLAAVRGDHVAFIDADSSDPSPAFVTGLFGPLLCEPGVEFVKASYRRPFTARGVEVPDAGGRVSQLTARPLLAALYPQLAVLAQPLAGEVAASRALLEAIPFATGYAVEIAMLIDVLGYAGAGAIAQVDVGERRNRHQPLAALRPMAELVLATVCERAGVATALETAPERKPFAALRAAA